jgi:hypothetical protein
MNLFTLALALVSSGTGSLPTKSVFEPLVVPSVAVPVLSAPVVGESAFSYSYVEAGATRLDLDTIDDEADTYFGRVSIALFGFLYVLGGYENQSVDFDNTDTDVWSLGVGAHFPLTDTFDVHGDASWMYTQIDSDTIDESDSGALVRLAARWMPFEFGGGGGLELHGGALWLSADESLLSDDDVFGFEAGLRVHVIRALSLDATYTDLGDDDQAALSARFSF